MNEAPGPKLLTLAEVVTQFKGRIGKTKLVQHINATPRFAGGPTHRKIGAKYLFTHEDVARIIDSLAPREDEKQPAMNGQAKAVPSEQKAYDRAMERLTRGTAAPKRQRAKLTRKG